MLECIQSNDLFKSFMEVTHIPFSALQGGSRMYLMAIDESGGFEFHRSPGYALIGGFIFSYSSSEELEQEEANLETLFTTVCKEEDAVLACDMHPRYMKNSFGKSFVANREPLTRVKNRLAQELPAFLKGTGKWQGIRSGNTGYCLLSLSGDIRGIRDYTGSPDIPLSNLQDDQYAANRYEHMVYRTIENALFYNPYMRGEKNIKLHLPTRVYDTGGDYSIKKQFTDLGYQKVRKKDGLWDYNMFVVADEETFRTCLSAALANADHTDLQFEIKVTHTCYDNYKKDQGFLYLADTVCSVLQNLVSGAENTADALVRMRDGLRSYVDDDHLLLWAYHPIDVIWRNVWMDYSHSHWFESLKAVADAKQKYPVLSGIYDAIWFRKTVSLLRADPDRSALLEAVRKLDLYMDNKKEYRHITARSIADILESHTCFSGISEADSGNKPLLFLLAKSKMAIYNHEGKFAKAQEEYDRCMRLSSYVPIEEFLGIQLRKCVSLTDAGSYSEAETLAAGIVAHHRELNRIRSEFTGCSPVVSPSCGRALSTLGQCNAFTGNTQAAAGHFSEALSCYAEYSVDWYITGSYYLHTLIEAGEKEQYETFARKYFLRSTLRKQFHSILSGKCGNIAFSLFVFLKGIWFLNQEISVPDLSAILEESVSYYRAQKASGHPWQLILKYCALLRLKYFESSPSDHGGSRELMAMAEAAVEPEESILAQILEEGKAQYLRALQGDYRYSDRKLRFTYI